MKIKQLLLFLTAVFSIIACEKDLYEDAIQQNQDKQINIKQISLEKFNSKIQLMKNKPDLERFMVSSKNSSLQSRTESTSGFEIVTSDIKEITQGDYTSYTMYLKTPDTTSNIYNITIEEIDGYSSFFITKYIPTTYWLENKDQPFDGEIITYRESNTNSSGANTLQEYLDLINGELYAGGAGGGGSLSLTGTSSGTSWSSGLGGSPIYPQNCNGTVKTDYILEPRACASGHHMPGQSCEYLNPSYPQYNLSNGPYYQSTPYYTCVPNTTSGGNTSGSGDTSGGNTLGGGGSGSGTGTGSGGTSTGSVTGSITTIVDPTEECNAPRGDLNNDCILDEDEFNFVTFLDNLTQEERQLVDGDNNIKISIFNYLAAQNWNNESVVFAEEAINDLINDECTVLLSVTNPLYIVANYDSSLFGSYLEDQTDHDHDAIQQQFNIIRSTQGDLVAVTYLINTYDLNNFRNGYYVNTNYTITFENGLSNGAHANAIRQFTNGVLTSCNLEIDTNLFSIADFGYITRVIKHELLHVLQGEIHGQTQSVALQEFQAYYNQLFGFTDLKKLQDVGIVEGLLDKLIENMNQLSDSEKLQNKRQIDFIKLYYPELCKR